MALIKKKLTEDDITESMDIVNAMDINISRLMAESEVPFEELKEDDVIKVSKALKRKRRLIAKYHGKEFKPKHKGYYGEGIEPYQLICDDVKEKNLGTGCERTVMLHFKGEPINKWEILKHFNKCK